MVFSKVQSVAASVFKIDPDVITLELGYQQINSWDSMNHIHLMLALEKEFGATINEEEILQLTTISAICQFLENSTNQLSKQQTLLHTTDISKDSIHRGLNGVFYDYSSICLIDGANGKLYYRGYNIEQIVANHSFEEVMGLLILGSFPDLEQLADIKHKLYQLLQLPVEMVEITKSLKNHKPLYVIQALISYYANILDDAYVTDIRDVAFCMLNVIPLIIGQFNLLRNGIDQVAKFNPDWSYAKNVLYFLTLKEPDETITNYFDKDLILHAEHDSNASTFVARICASTKASPVSAIIAAISAFSGALHGGALENVAQMIDEIGVPSNASSYIKNRLDNNLPIFGYGHRIYRTLDPRAKYMDIVARQISIDKNDMNNYQILSNVNECMKPYADRGIAPNVDFYDAVIYKLLNVPEDLFLPAFIVARLSGWFAHLKEQYSNNILIRPKLKYKGAEQ